MNEEVAALIGYGAGRVGCLKILKWFGAFVLLASGVAGFAGSTNPIEFLASFVMVSFPFAWFFAHRTVRKQKQLRLYREAVAAIQRDLQFTGNEAVGRQQAVEIAHATGQTPEAVWADVMATS